jgi:hypothetical protein
MPGFPGVRKNEAANILTCSKMTLCREISLNEISFRNGFKYHVKLLHSFQVFSHLLA